MFGACSVAFCRASALKRTSQSSIRHRPVFSTELKRRDTRQRRGQSRTLNQKRNDFFFLFFVAFYTFKTQRKLCSEHTRNKNSRNEKNKQRKQTNESGLGSWTSAVVTSSRNKRRRGHVSNVPVTEEEEEEEEERGGYIFSFCYLSLH